MNDTKSQITIFFAIPCGEFFAAQNKCIKNVCESVGVKAVIVEDHSKTAGLWTIITEKIDSADYFVADISSKSPNVILELGYSIREKKSRYNAIFIADNTPVPVDLQGFTLQKYTSLCDFQNKLIKWMIDNIPLVDSRKLDSLNTRSFDFRDDFKEYDRFLKLWSFPPQSSFQLTHEGLRFTNAHFPIMTTHLALLKNYEFEFKAKIESRTLGWIVKGTRQGAMPSSRYLLTFCVMFNIKGDGKLRPHIFNYNNLSRDFSYHQFDEQQVELDVSQEGWFTLVTRVVGDQITILNDGNTVFDEDFTVGRYGEAYEFANKQGEVGFRCHPGEQGVINYVRVKEI